MGVSILQRIKETAEMRLALAAVVLLASLVSATSTDTPDSAMTNPRQKKMFLVSFSSTTTTMSSFIYCIKSGTTAATACTKRKKRAILEASQDLMISPTEPVREDRLGEVSQENLNSGLGEAESDRQGRFAMYWMTTTFTSTTTSYTATTTIASVECTPSGFTLTYCSVLNGVF